MITFHKWLKTESVGSDERVSLANNLLDKVEKGAIQEEIDAAYSALAKYLRDNGLMSYSGMVIDAWGKGIKKTKEIMKIVTGNIQETKSEMSITTGDKTKAMTGFVTVKCQYPLSVFEAEEISKFEGSSLTLITHFFAPEIAKIIAKTKVLRLTIEKLKTITPEAAAFLTNFGGEYIELKDVEKLDGDTAKAFSSFNGRGYKHLNLQYCNQVDEKATNEIGNNWDFQAYLGISIDDLTVEKAENLANYSGEDLVLPAIPSINHLPEEQKEILSKARDNGKNILFGIFAQ